MYLIDGLLILAMTFFFVLPITDRKTVRMKMSVVGSLGVLLVAGLALWAGFRFNTLPVGIIMPALTLIGWVYLVIALLYWFRAPAIGVAIGTCCFAAAWVLSLR